MIVSIRGLGDQAASGLERAVVAAFRVTSTLKTKAALLLGDFTTKWPESSSQSLSGSLPEDYLLKRFGPLADTNQ
jgi:hypothetical protein